MNEDFNILEAIEIAMEAELKASNFYKEAVSKVTSERGKDLLQQLSDFEQNHYNRLNKLKKSLTEEGKFIEYEGTKFKTVPSEVKGKIENNKDEVADILIVAIDAETKAYENYSKMANQTNDPKGKDMFFKLADEETLHRRILSDEFYHISNQGGVWVWGD